MTICPKCGHTLYRGTKREVEPTECALEDGAACRAYMHGVEVGSSEADRLRIALRNVRALAASRLRKTDAENAGHLLRFCEEAGIVAEVLR